MTGEKPAVLLTAVLDLLQEIFQEEILYQLQIIQRYAGKGFALFPQENFPEGAPSDHSRNAP